MRDLAQQARAGRLAALQYLAQRRTAETSEKFSSVIVEFDRILNDPRLKSVSSPDGVSRFSPLRQVEPNQLRRIATTEQRWSLPPFTYNVLADIAGVQ